MNRTSAARQALLLLILATFPALCAGDAPAIPDWAAQFKNPPVEYGPGVYWWWFGPAVTRQEAARELSVMRRANISSVLIYPVYPLSVDAPGKGIKNLRYLSPEFLDVLAYAARRAKELGMTVDLVMGTGWPYGGPAITPELAAKRLRVDTRSPGANGHVALPALTQHERLVAALLVEGDGKSADLGSVVDVTASAAGGGAIPAARVTGSRVLMSFIESPTGMQVKRPSLGGEGLVLDHLNVKALDTFLDAVGGKLHRAAGGAVRAMHSDSLEVFGEEWTSNLPAEFAKRRGYDLKPYLPALIADSGPLTADIRYDFWRTVGELAMDNYVRPLHEWCRRHGVGLEAESYGTPPVDLGSFGEVDYPMGESYDWKMFVASRWASSAAHQYGKRVTAAEAYTWLRFPRYVSTLQDVKAGSDLHFICGINKLVAHGYGYSPPAAGVPGWGYYASILLNDNNPWWPYFPLLSDYVRRASFALTLGKPRVDVALYLPEDDVMAREPVGSGLNLYMSTKLRLGGGASVPEFGLPSAYASESAVIKTILVNGYTFDGFDRSILQPTLKTSAGRLEAGDAAYRIVILPNLKGISLAVLEKLAEFCRSGGVLLATKRLPEAAYGVMRREENYARVRKLVADLFGKGPEDRIRRNEYGRGAAIYVPDETKELSRVLASLRPEVRWERADAGLVFLHRAEGLRHIYFLANTSAQSKEFKAAFRDGHGRPQFWDAMTGDVADAPLFTRTASGVEVPIYLEPYGSMFVVFDGTVKPSPIRSTNLPPSSLHWDSGSKSWIARVSQARRLAIAGPWSLLLKGVSSAPIRLDRLKSWTEIPEGRFFSGRGDYEAVFDLPAEVSGADRGLWLELGEVREIADVSVNGHPAGIRWKLPYRVDISSWAKPGKNVLAIGVTNLLINRVLGEPDPDYSGLGPLRFALPQEKKMVPAPLPAGLLGPVEIVPYLVVTMR